MSLEVLGTAAAVGTFIVIAASAIAAVVQLGHMRAANQISVLQTFTHMYEGPDYREAFHFVRAELAKRMEDAEFRRELRTGVLDRSKHPEISICNFFEQWARNYRSGSINKADFLKDVGNVYTGFWDTLEPVIAILAEDSGGVNTSFENFEFLVIQAREWAAHHPQGTFPAGFTRIPLTDRWKPIDAAPGPGSGK